MPPNGNYGPANYNQGPDPSTSDAFNNMVRYQDMIQYQTVSQFQQGKNQDSDNSLKMQHQYYTQPRFQYGVQHMDPRFYLRQSEIARTNYGSAIFKGAAGMAGWEAGALGASIIGKGGLMGGFAIPFAASSALMYPLSKSIERSLERQRYMQSIASDIETYKGGLGFSSLSYNQASQLGSNMQNSMFKPGQFFSKDQQMSVHKMAISNGLINARGSGIDNGTIKQYEKNFKELLKTTENVVKLLQTTKEGGLSVMKELMGSGFTTTSAINRQITQASSLGSLTGIGSQNMMNLARAGASAVQGTPWSAMAGANAFQVNATSASLMAQANSNSAYAVQRVGGAAQAGALLTQSQMALMSSGMGTKVMAYAMNTNGSINHDRLKNIALGNTSAYDVVTGANSVGYGMGSSRVRFGLFKQRAMNKLQEQDPSFLSSMTNQVFGLWSSQRRGSVKDKAWEFAGQFSNDERSRELMYESLLNPKGFDRVSAMNSITRASIQDVSFTSTPKGLVGAVSRVSKKATRELDQIGDLITYNSGRAIGAIGRTASDIGYSLNRIGTGFMKFIGPSDEYGNSDFSRIGDRSSAMRAMYGLNGSASASGYAKMYNMSSADYNNLPRMKDINLDVGMRKLINTNNTRDINSAITKVGTALWNGTASTLYKDDNLMRVLGAKSGTDVFNMFKNNSEVAANSFINSFNQVRTSIGKEMEMSNSDFINIVKDKKFNEADRAELRGLESRATAYFNTYGNLSGFYTKGEVGRFGQPVIDKLNDKVSVTSASAKFKDIASWNSKSINMKDIKTAERGAVLGFYSLNNTNLPQSAKKNAWAQDNNYISNVGNMIGLIKDATGLNINVKNDESLKTGINKAREIITAGGEQAKQLDESYRRRFGITDKSNGVFSSSFNKNLDAAIAAITNAQSAQAVQDVSARSSSQYNIMVEAGLIDPKKRGAMTMDRWTGLAAGQIKGGAVSSSDLKLVAGITGVDLSVAQMWNKDGDLATKMMSTQASTDGMVKDQMDLAKAEFNKWIDIKTSMGSDKNIKLKERDESGKEVEKKYNKYFIESKIEKARADMTAALFQTDPTDTSRGSSIYTNVAPPVLNYWNNRWVL